MDNMNVYIYIHICMHIHVCTWPSARYEQGRRSRAMPPAVLLAPTRGNRDSSSSFPVSFFPFSYALSVDPCESRDGTISGGRAVGLQPLFPPRQQQSPLRCVQDTPFGLGPPFFGSFHRFSSSWLRRVGLGASSVRRDRVGGSVRRSRGRGRGRRSGRCRCRWRRRRSLIAWP